MRGSNPTNRKVDFMNPLVPYIWIAGVVHLMIVGMNLPLPRVLHYRENLSKVPVIIRQIFIVHSVYIVLVLVGFSLLCFLFAEDLCGKTHLGSFLSGFLAIFWLIRLFIQLFYYDPEMKKKYYLVHIGFTFAVTFLSAVFLIAWL